MESCVSIEDKDRKMMVLLATSIGLRSDSVYNVDIGSFIRNHTATDGERVTVYRPKPSKTDPTGSAPEQYIYGSTHPSRDFGLLINEYYEAFQGGISF